MNSGFTGFTGFREYKSPIFLGFMFLFLAILGFPYMKNDIAHTTPFIGIAMYIVGVLVALGALCMYIFNIKADTFIASISTIVILATIFSKLDISGNHSTFPKFVTEIIQVLVAGLVLFGGYLGAKYAVERGMPENSTLRGAIAHFVGIAPIGLWGLLAYAIYRAIKGLLEYRRAKTNIISNSVPRYEGFQTTVSTPAKTDLVDQLEAAIERIQDTLYELVEYTDDTCAIINEVEQGYIAAKSAPENEAEFELPEEEQKSRKQKRQESALKAFVAQRQIYSATRETSPLECFQNLTSLEYDVTVQELCIQLHNLLENGEILKYIQKIKQMDVELDFADSQLSRAELFQNITKITEAPTQSPTHPTQIYSTLRGDALVSAARNLLAKELNLYNSVVQIQQKIKGVRNRISKGYNKANMIATGDYNLPK